MYGHGKFQRGQGGGRGKKLVESIRKLLDYPSVNCEQCNENLRIDGINPECGGCHIREVSELSTRVINIFFAAGGRESLTQYNILLQLQLENIPQHEWPLYFRLTKKLSSEIKAHDNAKQS